MNNGSIDNTAHFTCGKMGQPSPLFCIADEDKGLLGSVKLLTRKENKIKGIVTAQQCKYCCHHEIEIITKNGHYLALKPGMKVDVFIE
jgi:hypothetical protein